MFCDNQQVQKSVDNQFKKAIEQYRDDPDLQNAIDAVQEGVSKGIMIFVLHWCRLFKTWKTNRSSYSEQEALTSQEYKIKSSLPVQYYALVD